MVETQKITTYFPLHQFRKSEINSLSKMKPLQSFLHLLKRLNNCLNYTSFLVPRSNISTNNTFGSQVVQILFDVGDDATTQ